MVWRSLSDIARLLGQGQGNGLLPAQQAAWASSTHLLLFPLPQISCQRGKGQPTHAEHTGWVCPVAEFHVGNVAFCRAALFVLTENVAPPSRLVTVWEVAQGEELSMSRTLQMPCKSRQELSGLISRASPTLTCLNSCIWASYFAEFFVCLISFPHHRNSESGAIIVTPCSVWETDIQRI